MSARAAGTRAEHNARTLLSGRATADSLYKKRTVGDVRRRAPAACITAFRREVLSYWKKHGRHDLPWRKTTDPYKILVSEVMLQQTQVPRVLEKYREFLKKFPNIRRLAKAPLADVLKAWSGLGYNRRGKYLHDAAKAIVQKYKGIVPKDVHELRALPGMGPYTASAVRVFAHNLPDILLETNVRAVLIHRFFHDKENVHDSDLIPIATLATDGMDARTWHWALMDYGVHIKKIHKNPTRRSAHYVVQTKFHGSLRQVRGAILKILNEGAHGDLAISKKLDFDDFYVRKALTDLKKDGLITSEKGSWRIA